MDIGVREASMSEPSCLFLCVVGICRITFLLLRTSHRNEALMNEMTTAIKATNHGAIYVSEFIKPTSLPRLSSSLVCFAKVTARWIDFTINSCSNSACYRFQVNVAFALDNNDGETIAESYVAIIGCLLRVPCGGRCDE